MSAPVLAYVHGADMYCGDCIGSTFDRRRDETTEGALDRVAAKRDIDRDREDDIDQNDFPVRVYDIEDCIDEEGRPYSCGSCLAPLGVEPY